MNKKHPCTKKSLSSLILAVYNYRIEQGQSTHIRYVDALIRNPVSMITHHSFNSAFIQSQNIDKHLQGIK